MGNVFGAKEKDIKEVLRENERLIRRAVNDLDKEIRNLEKEQSKIVADIKRNAKAGQPAAARSLAKGYVRSKNYIARFIMMKTQMKGIALQMQTMKSTQSMTAAMKGVTQALQQMNKNMDLSVLTGILADFAKEEEISKTSQEMVGEMIDDTMNQEGDAEQEDLLISQVMDELGIDLAATLAGGSSSSLPQSKVAAPAAATTVAAGPIAAGGAGGPGNGGDAPPPPTAGDLDIEERLRNLRK